MPIVSGVVGSAGSDVRSVPSPFGRSCQALNYDRPLGACAFARPTVIHSISASTLLHISLFISVMTSSSRPRSSPRKFTRCCACRHHLVASTASDARCARSQSPCTFTASLAITHLVGSSFCLPAVSSVWRIKTIGPRLPLVPQSASQPLASACQRVDVRNMFEIWESRVPVLQGDFDETVSSNMNAANK